MSRSRDRDAEQSSSCPSTAPAIRLIIAISFWRQDFVARERSKTSTIVSSCRQRLWHLLCQAHLVLAPWPWDCDLFLSSCSRIPTCRVVWNALRERDSGSGLPSRSNCLFRSGRLEHRRSSRWTLYCRAVYGAKMMSGWVLEEDELRCYHNARCESFVPGPLGLRRSARLEESS